MTFSSRAIGEASQLRQVFNILVHISRLGRFQQHRNVLEPRVLQDMPETIQAHKAFANVFVPISSTSQIELGIIEMEYLQPIESQYLAKIGKYLCVAFLRPEIIARCQRVTGIKAYNEATAGLHAIYHRRQLLKAVSKIAALSSSRL